MARNCNNCKNEDCFWYGLDDDDVCDEYIPKTNADRVRSMTDEELAELLHSQFVFSNSYLPSEWWLEWLKQECAE